MALLSVNGLQREPIRVRAQTEGLSLLGRVLLDPYFGPRGSLFLGFRGVFRFSISMIFCVFLIVPGALGSLPSDRAHREDSDGMEIVFWDALGPEL